MTEEKTEAPPATETKPAETAATTLVTAAPKVAEPAHWAATLPEELRAAPELAKYKTLDEFAKGHLEQSKLVGRKALTPPDAHSTPEQVAAWRKALGVPDDPKDYVTSGVRLPEIAADPAWNQEAQAEFFALAHQHHLTPGALTAILGFYGAMEAKKRDAAVRETQGAAAELRTEWGPTYEANLGRANRAIQEFGGSALVDRWAANGEGRDPLVVKTFAKIGNALVESGAMASEGLAQGLTAGEAKEKVQAIRKEMAALPEGHPRTRDLIDQIVALQRVIDRG